MKWTFGKPIPWQQQSLHTPVPKQVHLAVLEKSVVATLQSAFVTSQVGEKTLDCAVKLSLTMFFFFSSPSGCGNNPFALGARNFYGPGLTVDTSKPFTVVTQFITADNTTNGTLSEIRRLYIQNGKLIENAMITNLSGQSVQLPGTVNQDFCTARNASAYLRLGGMSGMGQSLSRGMVLIFSLWNSDDDFMNCTNILPVINAGLFTNAVWQYVGLDSGDAGPCNATAGDPAGILARTPELSVTFSNIK